MKPTCNVDGTAEDVCVLVDHSEDADVPSVGADETPAFSPAPAKANDMGIGSTTAESDDSSELDAASVGEEPANDNAPAEPTPGTGTDGT